MNDLIGKTLGQYEIIKLIGRGGMASVYLARQRSIGRMVAVKVLPSHLMSDDTFLKRFQREVQAVSRMQHPRIIPVHDYGEDEGVPYIVMAYIEGGSLAQLIQEKGALPLDDTVRLIGQITEGLDYAHQQGVIHRDFKPSNVLLDKQGNAYLLDFGIAKVSQETAQLTGSGIVGTPTYMAPEMFKQELPTPAVDIYALGVTLYQMLSGTTPFEGTTPVQLMYSHLNEPVPSIASIRPDLPASIQIVLDKAMAKRPEERFASAGDMANALRHAAEGDTLEFEAPRDEAPTLPPSEASPAPESTSVLAAPPIQPTAAAIPPNEKRQPEPEPTRAEEPRRYEREKRKKPHYHPGGKGPGCFWAVVAIVVIIIFLGRGASWLKGLLSDVNFGKADTTTQAISQAIGEADSVEVTLDPGLVGGILTVDSMSSAENVLEGEYNSSIGGKLETTYKMLGSTGQLTLKRGDSNFKPPNGDFTEKLALSLTDVLPIDLTIKTSIGEATLDLTGLDLQALTIESGIGTTTITLPEFGSYQANIKSGMGKLVIEIPSGLEARVEIQGGDLADVTVTNDTLVKVDDTDWQTANYIDATEHIRIKIDAGVGNIIIE
jgi:serine/threonine protein kinase